METTNWIKAHGKDLSGKAFGRWMVIQMHGVRNTQSTWLCRCSCGMTKVVLGGLLRSGRSKSCGCLAIEIASKLSLTHGESRHGNESKEFTTWNAMLCRCSNKTHKQWDAYGGRGIFVCDRWKKSFENFLADMGRRPEKHSLDRINNDGPYSPENCRWATRSQQCGNTRRNKKLTAFGQTKNLIDWARDTGIKENTITERIRRGWSVEKALSASVQAQDHSRRFR